MDIYYLSTVSVLLHLLGLVLWPRVGSIWNAPGAVKRMCVLLLLVGTFYRRKLGPVG